MRAWKKLRVLRMPAGSIRAAMRPAGTHSRGHMSQEGKRSCATSCTTPPRNQVKRNEHAYDHKDFAKINHC